MATSCIHFLLVPDRSAARRLRRRIADNGARTGVVVGTWTELLESARQAYLLPEPDGEWRSAFEEALAGLPDAFWAQSYAVARDETGTAVATALRELLGALGPSEAVDGIGMDALTPRARRHLTDLGLLRDELGDSLPDELATIRALYGASPKDAIAGLRVYRVADLPRLDRWQAALVEKLNADAGEGEGTHLADLLAAMGGDRPRGIAGSALTRLQTGLYASDAVRGPLDESVQWLGLRDALEEVEVAAGMTQALIAADAALVPADIGLLVPGDPDYIARVREVFTHSGLALSGLPAAQSMRDLGREALFHFLLCCRKPAPAMAIAACLESPLMPWDLKDGATLAQNVMDGDYRLAAPVEASADAERMLALLRRGADTPTALAAATREFVSLLTNDVAMHFARVRESASAVEAALATMEALDWSTILALASPVALDDDADITYTQEGLTVCQEQQEPWREVKHLLVLGFSDGRYPATPSVSPVFTRDDLQIISEQLGLEVDTPADVLEGRRALFKRQIGSASDSLTFMIPRRDGFGELIAPSESLVFMGRLFEGIEDANDLALELDLVEERAKARHVPQADAAPPTPPRPVASDDLSLERNLLVNGADGSLKAQSPSSLETLMVSPLAWLLRRAGAEPAGWGPEELDVLLKGSLAHAVFEVLFAPECALPDDDAIETRVRAHLGEAIRRHAPFLQSTQWSVERRHLERELTAAAIAWRDALERLGAEVVAAEVWLQGRLGEVPIHGQADAILALPSGRLLVVDYKKSSVTSRLQRMQQGYDSQVTLYRTMLETGGPRDAGQAVLAERLAQSDETGILYCMLNDQSYLSDEGPPNGASVPGWNAIRGDVSENAMEIIRRDLAALSRGEVRLNRVGDATRFDKQAGMKPYAIENSPLIDLFSIDDDAGVIE